MKAIIKGDVNDWQLQQSTLDIDKKVSYNEKECCSKIKSDILFIKTEEEYVIKANYFDRKLESTINQEKPESKHDRKRRSIINRSMKYYIQKTAKELIAECEHQQLSVENQRMEDMLTFKRDRQDEKNQEPEFKLELTPKKVQQDDDP